MSDKENDIPLLPVKPEASETPISSNTSVNLPSKLDSLETNLDFLMKLGLHQDKLLQQAKIEINRLNSIVVSLSQKSEEIKTEEAQVVDSRNDFKAYFCNMSLKASTDAIKSYFEKYGKVNEVFILRQHPTNQNGIVQFTDKSSVADVVKIQSHTLEGRQFYVRRSVARQGPRTFGKPILSMNKLKAYDPKFKSSVASRNSRYSPY